MTYWSIKDIERETSRQPYGCTVLQNVCRLAQVCSKHQFGKKVQGRSHGSLHGVWPVEFSNGRRGAIHKCSDGLSDPVCLSVCLSVPQPPLVRLPLSHRSSKQMNTHPSPLRYNVRQLRQLLHLPNTLHCSVVTRWRTLSRSDWTVSDGRTMSGERVRKNVTGSNAGPL